MKTVTDEELDRWENPVDGEYYTFEEANALLAEDWSIRLRLIKAYRELRSQRDEQQKVIDAQYSDIEELRSDLKEYEEEFGRQNSALGKELLENEELRERIAELERERANKRITHAHSCNVLRSQIYELRQENERLRSAIKCEMNFTNEWATKADRYHKALEDIQGHKGKGLCDYLCDKADAALKGE
jgi:hypothetical protein